MAPACSPPWGERRTASRVGRGDGEQVHEQPLGPHVGPAGAGVVVHSEDGADLVVLEPGREDVGCRITASVGDEHDRTLILLTDVVSALLWGDRHGCRERGPGLGGLVE
jgi:hypothetical protein